MQEFRYEQLDADITEIRLLDLLPGPGNTICCNIRHVPLAKATNYEALSYCWGSMSRSKSISLNDCRFWVTENLHRALLQLKGPECRTLWVDAICIDQKNIPEKNIQVPLMRTIYESCSRAVIWLGEHDSRTETAFNALEYMAARLDEDPEASFVGTRWRAAQRGAQPTDGLWARFRDRLEALDGIIVLGSIFERQWFQRVWIVQELSVSPVAIVMCGEYKTSWRTIEKAYELSKAVFDMEDHLGDLVSFRKSWQKGSPSDVFAQMMLGWNQNATDARDKIYALMGLVSDTSIRIPVTVDYGKSVKSVYQQFTEKYIQVTKNTDILGVSRGCRDTGAWEAPSWVLDDEYDKVSQPFPQHSLSPIGDIEHTKLFQAGGNGDCQATLSSDHLLLGISGMQLEKIKKTSIEFSYTTPNKSIRGVIIDPWSNFANLLAFYLDARQLCQVEENGTYPHTGQSIHDAFWHTLEAFEPQWTEQDDPAQLRQECVAFDALASKVSHRLLSGKSRSMEILRNLQLHAAAAKDILKGTLIQGLFVKAYAAWKRRFIILENGYMGLGPRHAKVGDEVVLLQGRKAPLIVRQAGARWRVVGDCYVHGVMGGERFKSEECHSLWFE